MLDLIVTSSQKSQMCFLESVFFGYSRKRARQKFEKFTKKLFMHGYKFLIAGNIDGNGAWGSSLVQFHDCI